MIRLIMEIKGSIRLTAAVILVFIALVGGLSITVQSSQVSAHRSGCHRWHSCPSDSGSYTCGDTGYSNYCSPTTNYSTPSPIITTKDEVIEQSIPVVEVTKDNPNEYIGYKKLIIQGVEGLQTKTTTITYSDGTESSRGITSTSTTRKAINTVYDVGTRTKPTAWIDYISKSDNQSFWSFLLTEYDISASAQPDKDYALIKNDQVVRLGKSNKTGMLNFDAVGARTGDKFSIGTYEGSQFLWFMPSATKVSEISTADTDKLTIIAEYDKLHNKKSARTDESVKITECPQETKDYYVSSLDKTEKTFFDLLNSERIYYTEVPCDITIPKKD